MASHVFFASTPFNMLTASMVALTLPASDKKVLALIDQKAELGQFQQAVLNWQNSPFDLSLIASYQAKGKQKRAIRQQAFHNIKKLITELKPSHLYTGNDRRIEFQYAMSISSGKSLGIYIDDGTFSYLGGKNHWLKDRFLDNLVKKFAYGRWWQQPKTIGASNWINHSILAFPQQAYSLLKEKPIKQLPNNLDDVCFANLAHSLLQDFNLDGQKLAQINTLILLPHESVYNDSINQAVKQKFNRDISKLAIKHHPRTLNKDCCTIDYNFEIESNIPMEILLPLINNNCQVIGDVSTALLTAKWLKPQLVCTAIFTQPPSQKWLELLSMLNINSEQISL